MRNSAILIIIIAAVAIFGFAAMAWYPAAPKLGSAVVGLGGYSYNVFLATNQSEWRRGLMNYTFACATPGGCANGMLFVFPSSVSTCFWMKDTPEPLVQIWALNGIVTQVYNAIPEDTASVCGFGNEVLELNSRLPINAAVGAMLSG